MESNHRPSLAGTVFKTACAPCAPSSVVGAERIELPTSCSQSRRATAALRPEKLARQEGLEPSTRGIEARCSDPLSYWRNWLLATLSVRALQFCTPALFLVGPGHLRGPGYGQFQGGSWAYHSPQWPVRIRGLRPTQANPSSPFG